MQLAKKTILITGGSSGIGLEMARQLMARGNVVIVTGRGRGRLNAASRALPGLHTIESDVSDADAIVQLHGEILAQFPALDVLVNNAGIMRNLDLQQDRDLDDVTREIEIDLSGPVRMIQQFLPHLKTRPGALIVNVSSGLAFVPHPLSPVYSAAKAGIHAYTVALRVQLAGSGVTVVELAPPPVETPLLRAEFAEEMKGQNGMTPEKLVGRAIKGIQAGKTEIRPGIANVLRAMSRIAPNFMLRQLAKTVRAKAAVPMR